ncbi:MAG: FKBP-type peptidyl-prolyl cis-trans isomerase [Odoribacter sp.]|nr:FKBP-type peptidyl-prolyl cis-trans isomerase [Odoribacter sp.]
MNVKILLSILSLIAIFISGCNGGGSLDTKTANLKNADDSVSFYMGYDQGIRLAGYKINNLDREAYLAGFNQALAGDELEGDLQAIGAFINNYLDKNFQKIGQENLKKGQEFLAKNAKKSGVDTLADGVQYKVEKMGNGPIPKATDIVKIHYKGTYINGKEFDSSYQRGEEPIEVQANQFIPGFNQALQSMPAGSKWTVYIPSTQAYGPRGYGSIGPNETIIFEIELFEIVTPETQTQQ